MSVDRSVVEAAVRAALEGAVPGIVDAVMATLDDPPRPKLRADHDALSRLFVIAREGGTSAVLAALPGDPVSLRAIAMAADRVLAARFRKAKDIEQMRVLLAAVVHDQATRNDVFRHRSE